MAKLDNKIKGKSTSGSRQVFAEVSVSKDLDDDARLVIAQEMIDLIVDRSRNRRIDKNGTPLKGYSKSYANSLSGRIKGAKQGQAANLTLSREMLSSLKYLSSPKGKIKIGFDKDDTRNNQVAEGNIIGSYGGKKNPNKARDFLGLPVSETEKILKKYSPSRPNVLAERVQQGLSAIKAAEGLGDELVEAVEL